MPHITAALDTCLAVSTGWRIGSFSTDTVKRIRSVTVPSTAISWNGSRNGFPSRNSRDPSGLNGYVESDSCGYAIESGTRNESYPASSAAWASGT